MLTLTPILAANSMYLLLVMLDVAVKAFVLIAVAGLITLLLRRASAAMRHLAWTLALVSLVLLPVLSITMPQLQIPILPAGVSGIVKSEPAAGMAIATKPEIFPPDAGQAELPGPQRTVSPEAATLSPIPMDKETRPANSVMSSVTEDQAAKSVLHWSVWPLLVWLTGMFIVALSLVTGTVVVWRRGRRAIRITDGPLTKLLQEQRDRLGIKRPVGLLKTSFSGISANRCGCSGTPG